MSIFMDVTYSTSGLDTLTASTLIVDANATIPATITEQEIADPVTGIDGTGYEPGQKNRDGAISDGSTYLQSIGVCLAVGCGAGGIQAPMKTQYMKGPCRARRSTPSRSDG